MGSFYIYARRSCSLIDASMTVFAKDPDEKYPPPTTLNSGDLELTTTDIDVDPPECSVYLMMSASPVLHQDGPAQDGPACKIAHGRSIR